MTISHKNLEIFEIAKIQNKTEYILTEHNEDLSLTFEGYYNTIYISKYTDNTYFLNHNKVYFSCETLDEMIFYIQSL